MKIKRVCSFGQALFFDSSPFFHPARQAGTFLLQAEKDEDAGTG